MCTQAALSAWHSSVLVYFPPRLMLTLRLALGLTLTLVCSITPRMNLNVLIRKMGIFQLNLRCTYLISPHILTHEDWCFWHWHSNTGVMNSKLILNVMGRLLVNLIVITVTIYIEKNGEVFLHWQDLSEVAIAMLGWQLYGLFGYVWLDQTRLVLFEHVIFWLACALSKIRLHESPASCSVKVTCRSQFIFNESDRTE